MEIEIILKARSENTTYAVLDIGLCPRVTGKYLTSFLARDVM